MECKKIHKYGAVIFSLFHCDFLFPAQCLTQECRHTNTSLYNQRNFASVLWHSNQHLPQSFAHDNTDKFPSACHFRCHINNSTQLTLCIHMNVEWMKLVLTQTVWIENTKKTEKKTKKKTTNTTPPPPRKKRKEKNPLFICSTLTEACRSCTRKSGEWKMENMVRVGSQSIRDNEPSESWPWRLWMLSHVQYSAAHTHFLHHLVLPPTCSRSLSL